MSGIFTGVGSPGTVSVASGGFFLAYVLSSTPQQVAGSSPARRKITFHNPGATDAYVAPSFIQNSGSDQPLVPSPSALQGCFIVYGNGGTVVLEGEVQKPFQAFCLTGSAVLTVVPSNV